MENGIMRIVPAVWVLALSFVWGYSFAAPPYCNNGDQITNAPGAGGAANLTNLLRNSLVCGRPGSNYAGDSSDRWQEQHRTSVSKGGNLWDYHQGTDPTDPTDVVGNWSNNDVQVTYSYPATNATGPYTFGVWCENCCTGQGNNKVCTNSSGTTVFSFCDSNGEQVRAYIIAGGASSGPCSSYP